MPVRDANRESNDTRPAVVGFARNDVSGLHILRHVHAMRRHAETLGYRYLFTVRPPDRDNDPVDYLVRFIARMDLAAVVVFDLGAVDHSPARICEICDVETVCPPETWARVYSDGLSGEQRTEAETLSARWRHTRRADRRIEVLSACDRGTDPVTDVTFPRGTDLVDARAARPDWNTLWDKVQQEFWSAITSPRMPIGRERAGARE